MTVVPGPRAAWAEARTGPAELVLGLVILAAVAAGTVTGALPLVAIGVVGLGIVAAIRGGRFYLLVYVALIPFDGAVAFGGLATLSRLVAIAFVIAHVARRRGSLRIDTIGASGWAFVLLAGASYLWSIDRVETLPELLTLVQLVAVTLVVADLVLEDRTAARPVMLVYAASATLMGAIGLVAWVIDRGSLPAGRAVAFDGQDPAQYAALLIPALLVLVWETLRRPRLLPIAGAIVAALGLLASGTRSAWVAVVVVMAVGLVPRMTNRQRLGLAVLVGGLAIVTLSVPGLNDLTLGRLSAVISSGGTGRTDIWAIGLGVWTGAPLAGVGYGAFPSALTLEVVRATPLFTLNTGFLTPPIGSHSIIVGTLVELGILGLGCLVAFVWHVLRPRPAGELAEVARLAVMAMLIQALFLDILGRKQLWLFVALAVGLAATQLPGRGPADPEPDPDADSGGSPLIGPVLIGVGAATPPEPPPAPSAPGTPAPPVTPATSARARRARRRSSGQGRR